MWKELISGKQMTSTDRYSTPKELKSAVRIKTFSYQSLRTKQVDFLHDQYHDRNTFSHWWGRGIGIVSLIREMDVFKDCNCRQLFYINGLALRILAFRTFFHAFAWTDLPFLSSNWQCLCLNISLRSNAEMVEYEFPPILQKWPLKCSGRPPKCHPLER